MNTYDVDMGCEDLIFQPSLGRFARDLGQQSVFSSHRRPRLMDHQKNLSYRRQLARFVD